VQQNLVTARVQAGGHQLAWHGYVWPAFFPHTLVEDDALYRWFDDVNVGELEEVLHHDDLVETETEDVCSNATWWKQR
jgi:hypothetical protein